MGKCKNVYFETEDFILKNRSLAESSIDAILKRSQAARDVLKLMNEDKKRFENFVWNILDQSE